VRRSGRFVGVDYPDRLPFGNRVLDLSLLTVHVLTVHV